MIPRIESHEQLQEAVGGYRVARLIQTAVKLALFDQLHQPISAVDISKRLNLSIRGVEILCDALTAVGLLEKTDERYRNSRLATETLTSASGTMLRHSILHSEGIYRRWAHLEHAVIHGVPLPRERDLSTDREANRVFIMSMHANGIEKSRRMVDHLDLSDVRKAVDVAGGPGTYLIALLEKKPDIDATLIDLPLTLETAGEIIRDSGHADQFTLRAMDVFEGEGSFGENYDLAILSNILHIEDASRNERLLKRIHDCLRPGGKLVIQDFFTSADGTDPGDAAVFSVNMLTATLRGRSWPRAIVANWLKNAGFRSIDKPGTSLDSELWIVTA